MISVSSLQRAAHHQKVPSLPTLHTLHTTLLTLPPHSPHTSLSHPPSTLPSHFTPSPSLHTPFTPHYHTHPPHSPTLPPHSLDPDTNGLPKGLSQCLSLAHLQREHLTTRDSSEGCVGAEGLGHCHGDGSLPCPRLPGDEYRPTGYLPLLDQLQDDAGSSAGRLLAYHTLGGLRGREQGRGKGRESL